MESKKILYIEAPDGISGDMTLGALIDLGADVELVRRELDKFVPGEYALLTRAFERNGIHGINVDVVVEGEHGHEGEYLYEHDHGHEGWHEHEDGTAHGHEHDAGGGHEHSHEHRRYSDIKLMIENSGIAERAKGYALAIFDVIARAEAAVHRVAVADVAFHEVGAMDSIIDIVGTAIAIDLLDVDDIYCSAPHDGSGTITCRHGLIPVPVPAVVEMAKGSGVPIVIESDVHTEMITPTGFGIIKGLRAKFEPHLGLLTEKVGYGFGKRDTGRLGAVRLTLGEKYTEEEDKR